MQAYFNEMPTTSGRWRNLSTDSRIDLYTNGETIYIIPNDEKRRAVAGIARGQKSIFDWCMGRCIGLEG